MDKIKKIEKINLEKLTSQERNSYFFTKNGKIKKLTEVDRQAYQEHPFMYKNNQGFAWVYDSNETPWVYDRKNKPKIINLKDYKKQEEDIVINITHILHLPGHISNNRKSELDELVESIELLVKFIVDSIEYLAEMHARIYSSKEKEKTIIITKHLKIETCKNTSKNNLYTFLKTAQLFNKALKKRKRNYNLTITEELGNAEKITEAYKSSCWQEPTAYHWVQAKETKSKIPLEILYSYGMRKFKINQYPNKISKEPPHIYFKSNCHTEIIDNKNIKNIKIYSHAHLLDEPLQIPLTKWSYLNELKHLTFIIKV